MAALDTKSPYTAGHSKSVSDMVEILCRLLGLNRMMHIAAHLHDIVKIGIDDTILNKEGKLDEQEWEMMKTPLK
ncbi:HD-GYP domain-containing protein [Faecalibacillus intestinalis]|uniref:HD-GYP domain-containing protein n=1 Tax=Faecalibacillus intestinalis TaxID=1982626 RepID=UPI00352071B7